MNRQSPPFGLSILLLLSLAGLSMAAESGLDERASEQSVIEAILDGGGSCFPSPGSRCGPPLHLYSLSAWLKGGIARIVSGDSGAVLDTGRFLKVLHSRKDSVHGLPIREDYYKSSLKPKLRLEIRPEGRVRKAAVTCSECSHR